MGAKPSDRCRCGHEREAHEHFRRGSDCALCPPERPCDRFRPTTRWAWLRRS